MVPAHAGGVDLSLLLPSSFASSTGPRPCGRGGFKPWFIERHRNRVGPRPCGRGGFKQNGRQKRPGVPRPRPCGRGGFKHDKANEPAGSGEVPAHAGGVDLSDNSASQKDKGVGPRPCGRGGFKPCPAGVIVVGPGPRPCGRGGFKHVRQCRAAGVRRSPPMRAGWI